MAALVFVALDEVPAQNKVFGDVIHTVALQAHSDVVPGHAAEVDFADFIALPVLYALEVHDPVVVEVLSRENVIPQTPWVDIGQWVLVCIPSSETKVNTSDEAHIVINDDEFLVVSLDYC